MKDGPLARLRAELPLFGEPAEPAPPSAPQQVSAADVAVYLDGARATGEHSYAEGLAAARTHPAGFVWLSLTEPSMQTLTAAAATFGLHRLAVEDAVHGDQRPKLEEFGETSFIVLKTARYVAHERLTATSEVVETGELMIFIGAHFAVSVLRGPVCDLDHVRGRLAGAEHALLQHGPWGAGVRDHRHRGRRVPRRH